MNTENQESLNQSELGNKFKTDVSSRFFYFVYSYWTEKATGKGNLYLKTKTFPSQKCMKEKAIEQIALKYDEPSYKVSAIIENWIEMTEDDYTQWVS